MTVSAKGSSTGLRGQLNKLRNLAQPFFLPLDQATGWQFSGLLLALLFCVGGLVLIALTGLTGLSQQLLPEVQLTMSRLVKESQSFRSSNATSQ